MARNILVVEDDNNISNLIKMYLDKEGFDVRIAADGGKAVEEFKEKEPDLVLLDVMLPVLDGWGVCAKIRETSKCPIIMLTAKGEVNDRIHGLEMGADDYVVKPFEMKELLARINAVLRRSEIPEDTHKLLLLDEHTAALDPATAEKVLELTKKIVAENGITCLMITHNVQSALNLGNRTIMMKDGQIVMELSGQRRATITTEELLRAFQQQGLDNDRILFSAE